MLSDFYKLNKNHRTHTRGSSGSLNTHDTQDFLRAQIMKSLLIFSSFKTWPCSSDAADFLRPQIFLFLDAKPSDHFIFCLARKKVIYDLSRTNWRRWNLTVMIKNKIKENLLHRINMGTISTSVTIPLITSESSGDTTPGISFQSSKRTQVLIVTTPTSILETPSINFMCYLTTHVGKIIPAIASSVASLHF